MSHVKFWVKICLWHGSHISYSKFEHGLPPTLGEPWQTPQSDHEESVVTTTTTTTTSKRVPYPWSWVWPAHLLSGGGSFLPSSERDRAPNVCVLVSKAVWWKLSTTLATPPRPRPSNRVWLPMPCTIHKSPFGHFPLCPIADNYICTSKSKPTNIIVRMGKGGERERLATTFTPTNVDWKF